MFRDIKIIEDSETRVVVRARIERRRMAKDPYITASADNLRAELLKERPELDFSSFKCSKQNVEALRHRATVPKKCKKKVLFWQEKASYSQNREPSQSEGTDFPCLQNGSVHDLKIFKKDDKYLI